MKTKKIKTASRKGFGVTMALAILFQTGFPSFSMALTSGPQQEEYGSFEPAGTSDLVDLYSGDFTYNIPLLTVPGPNGGYPVNLAYHSGVTMEQEASWVGLGWNVNCGAVNRGMRGIPDDFDGDKVKKRLSMNKYFMVDANMSVPLTQGTGSYNEIFGFAPGGGGSKDWVYSLKLNLYYSNYKGIGFRGTFQSSKKLTNNGTVTTGVGLSFDSQSGIGIEPELGLTLPGKLDGDKISLLSSGMGVSYNSRDGINGGNILGFSFNTSQSVPTVSVPATTYVQPFSLKIGTAGGGAFNSPFYQQLSGSYIESQYPTGDVEYSAYGYMNTKNAGDNDMKDFTRSGAEYSKHLPNLPSSVFSSDNFSYSAQGAYGSFRPYLAGVPVLSSAQIVNPIKTWQPVEGLEVGWGSGVHVGLDLTFYNSFNSSGAWRKSGNGEISKDVRFKDGITNEFDLAKPSGAGPDFDEVVMMPNNELNRFLHKGGANFYDDWGGAQAMRAEIGKQGSWLQKSFTAEESFTNDGGTYTVSMSSSGKNIKNKEQKVRRESNIETLTWEKAKQYGRIKNVKYTPLGGGADVAIVSSTHKDKHIAEVSVLQSDGMRYNYALPVYNTNQQQVMYSADKTTANFNTYLVDITTNNTGDLEVENTFLKMKDITTIPEYAQSWLITSVTSADYVDATNDGLSEDDMGYWTRFHYKRDDDKDWRFPYRKAEFIEGNPDDATDDKAFYTFGKREVYYPDTIETKTHYAVFYTSMREDAVGSLGEYSNNSASTSTSADKKSQKLDSIRLYAKDRTTATAPTDFLVKTVHFAYNYDLCAGVYNNTGKAVNEDGTTTITTAKPNINGAAGKLTLKKVWFTYEKSSRGSFNPYVFNYSTNNPGYEPRNTDRWGNYKNNTSYLSTTNKYPLAKMPYSDQDDPVGGGNSSPVADAWTLKEITMPSGSKMNIEYESDAYSYVEDQKATRMFDFIGAENTTSVVHHKMDFAYHQPTNYDEIKLVPTVAFQNTYKLYFKLEQVASGHSDIVTKYLDNGNIKKMYFKNYTRIMPKTTGDIWDWVEGFADIVPGGTAGVDYGVEASSGTSGYDIGFVTVDGVQISGIPDKVHPYIAAAINHMRINRSNVPFDMYPNANGSSSTQFANFANAIAGLSLAEQAMAMLVGYNNWAYIRGCGHKIRLNGWSVLRLADPDEKFGGGLRVKKITFSDNWNTNGSTNQSQEYGQTYNYEMEDGSCSGVAYEPLNGDEESALTLPIDYSESVPLGGKRKYSLRTPLLKDYYPGQQVGYRRVIVKSIAPDRADLNGVTIAQSVAPLSVYEFYSPKEFPVYFDDTKMNEDAPIIRPFTIPGILSGFKKKIARSQGYVLELNDMAGKLRSVASYTRSLADANPSQVGQQFSKTEYIYQTDAPFNQNTRNHLNNKASVITSYGNYETAYLGLNEEVYLDMNENKYISKTNTLAFNFDLVGVVPSIVYLPIPNENTETSLRTVVTNKIITRRGILKETKVKSDQSLIKTEIVAYDYETGNPLLTKANNEYNDAIYNYTEPAHWHYPLMAGAYKNYGLTISGAIGNPNGVGYINIAGVIPTGKNASDYFAVGDKVAIKYGSTPSYILGHVLYTYDNGTAHALYIIDADGNKITSTSTPTVSAISEITVIESGYRNQTDYDAGAVVAEDLSGIVKYDPMNNSGTTISNGTYSITQSKRILNASAVKYTDMSQMYCDRTCNTTNNQVYNPFVWKTRGVWKPYKSYTYITDRYTSANTSPNTAQDLRKDGYFTNFDLFDWSYNASNNNWTEAGKITKFSNYGFTLEQKDALGNYSASLYGYGLALNTAVAGNAMYHDIAFKSFEDDIIHIPNDNCQPYWEHVAQVPEADLSTAEAHTGLRSLKISPGNSKGITALTFTENCDTYYDDYTRPYGTLTEQPPLYNTGGCNCLNKFSPTPDKKYVVSAWGKLPQSNGYNDYRDYTNLTLRVKFFATGGAQIGSTIIINPSGKHIEGWQRYYGEFVIPANASSISIEAHNADGSKNAYLDDLRVHPYNSSMVSYVYHPVTYKLMAQLDANNYSAQIGYDEQGSAANSKKETAKGLKTIAAGKVHVKKQ